MTLAVVQLPVAATGVAFIANREPNTVARINNNLIRFNYFTYLTFQPDMMLLTNGMNPELNYRRSSTFVHLL